MLIRVITVAQPLMMLEVAAVVLVLLVKLVM